MDNGKVKIEADKIPNIFQIWYSFWHGEYSSDFSGLLKYGFKISFKGN